MAFHLVFLPTILLLLPCAVDLSNVIELDEKTSSAVYFTPGSSVKIGWVYKFSEDEQEFGEFFCGYRNNDGRVFPLAIDVDGEWFQLAFLIYLLILRVFCLQNHHVCKSNLSSINKLV